MAYPTSTQEMVARLLADRAFEVQTIVNDNYPAVREQFEALLQSDQPQLINTPEKLVQQLLWWDQGQGGRATVDPVLSVPYRGATGSNVLATAVAQLEEMAGQSEGSPFGATEGIVAYVGALKETPAGTAAEQVVKEVEATAQAAADAAKAAAKNRMFRTLVIVVVLVTIGALIYYTAKK